ncbi:hypothetical protein FO519_005004 [Halicephalobus sp. NKZ332]|nr:hypothetical protein FO519_005004 [Halicephalobus sp. NKZ332]
MIQLGQVTGHSVETIHSGDHFTDLIKAQVHVVVDDLEIINVSENKTRIIDRNFNPDCQLTLHRDLCVNPEIKRRETIGWNTRICFSWKCANASNYAMRVESCWTGSSHDPIYLIDEHGCSMEKTMVRSPRYDPSLLQAHSIGWLSVRVSGARYTRLSCSIKMCHLCDTQCSSITPPKYCPDDPNSWKISSVWNQTSKLDHLCRPTAIVKRLRSKAAATVSYADSIWLIAAVIFFKLILK